MISSTGKGIRNDGAGQGHYGAGRGRKVHQGMDDICEPGQDVVAPISGKIVRKAYPYSDKSYGGLMIQGPRMAVKLFYFKPASGIVGKQVRQGDVIGTAMDITLRYPDDEDMTPHIHREICSIDPGIFTD